MPKRTCFDRFNWWCLYPINIRDANRTRACRHFKFNTHCFVLY